jgi:hypothetical protein
MCLRTGSRAANLERRYRSPYLLGRLRIRGQPVFWIVLLRKSPHNDLFVFLQSK